VSNIPDHLLYTEEHEYVLKNDDPSVVTIGITDYAQGELGDVVYVDLPAVGDTVEQGKTFGTIEAVKAVSELYCPVSGKVVEINDSLEADSAVVNRDPYGEGWMIRLRMSDPDELDTLLPADSYRSHIGE
jgi:glycine cleavage system H protein